MNELVEWLRAQIDEDEQWARSAMGDTAGEWAEFGQPFPEIVLYDKSGRLTVGHMQHIARHDPARVLRDVEANRLIMAIHRAEPDGEARHWRFPERGCIGCGWDQYEEAAVDYINDCPTLRALALSYADRPGYLEEWRPDPSTARPSTEE